MIVFFLMIRRPPRSTRTDTLFPYTTLFRSAAPVAAARGESLSMLAPPPEPLSPFTLCETHGIFGLPGCRVRYSSAELGWSSLFLSEQDEARLCCKLRSEEHTSELQLLMRTSYAVFCLKKKKTKQKTNTET